jgi:hypothetical protein
VWMVGKLSEGVMGFTTLQIIQPAESQRLVNFMHHYKWIVTLQIFVQHPFEASSCMAGSGTSFYIHTVESNCSLTENRVSFIGM